MADTDGAESPVSLSSTPRLTSGSPTPQPIESPLQDAIGTASPEVLRTVLQRLCSDSKNAEALAKSMLLDSMPEGKQRKTYESCKNCKIEYDVTGNQKGGCVYHPGKCHFEGSSFECRVSTDKL